MENVAAFAQPNPDILTSTIEEANSGQRCHKNGHAEPAERRFPKSFGPAQRTRGGPVAFGVHPSGCLRARNCTSFTGIAPTPSPISFFGCEFAHRRCKNKLYEMKAWRSVGLVVVWVSLANSLQATVFYVATNGNDAASGVSVTDPFRTVVKALVSAQYGDTIYIRGGVYRQNVQYPEDLWTKTGGSISNMLHVLAYPGERPVISGAVSITQGWQLVPQPIIQTYSYPSKAADPVVVDDWILGVTNTSVWSVPWPTRSQQVFLVTNSGTTAEQRFPLQQLGWSSSDVGWIYEILPNGEGRRRDNRPPIQTNWTDRSFFWSTNSGGTLYIRLPPSVSPSDPSVVIEAGKHASFEVGGDYLHVRGITFRHSNDGASGVGTRKGCLLEGCVVEWMALDGLVVQEGSIITNCVIKSAGRTGLTVPSRFSLFSTTVSSNNYRFFPNFDHSGGVKCVNFPGVSNDYGGTLIASNQFLGNYGYGLWFDTQQNLNSNHVRICNNLFAFNARPTNALVNSVIDAGGIAMENSGSPTGGEFRIYNNVFATNDLAIFVYNSSSCKLQNNTIITGLPALGFLFGGNSPRSVPVNNTFANNILFQTHPWSLLSIQTGLTKDGVYYNLLQTNAIDNNCYFCAQPYGVISTLCDDDWSVPNPLCDCLYNQTFTQYAQICRPYWENSSIVADPQLDARLRPGLNSPVAGKAVSSLPRAALFPVTQDYLGNPRPRQPDIGALNSIRLLPPGDLHVLSNRPATFPLQPGLQRPVPGGTQIR